MRIATKLTCIGTLLAGTVAFGTSSAPTVSHPIALRAMVRFENQLTSPDSVSLAANGAVLFRNIAAGERTNYITVADSTVTLTLLGGGPDSLLASTNGMLLDQSRYTVIAINGDDDRPILELERD